MRRVAHFLCALTLVLAGCGGADPADAPAIGLETGNRAPVLEGVDADSLPFTVEAGGGAPYVVVFYSSATCGLCRLQLERMQQNLPAYRRSGASPVAVSLDPPGASRAFRDSAGIAFPLVSVDSATFATWTHTDSALGSPPPATYILDGSGIIRFRHIGRNSSDRTTDAGMISILSELDVP